MAQGEVGRESVGQHLSVEEQAQDANAAYDAWFQAEVAEGLREADDPSTEWISNEEAVRQSTELRREWLRRAEAKRETA